MSEEGRPRTALCLCGGGITGGMYELGALTALDDFLGGNDGRRCSVNHFDLYVGTSAGAFLATTVAAGMSPRTLFRAVLDDDPRALPARRTDIYRFNPRAAGEIVRDLVGVALTSMMKARRGFAGPMEVVADLLDVLPAGIFSLEHYEKYLERFLRHHDLPTRFADVARELYITANDLDSGHRQLFGKGGIADIPIAKAICASSAIPLFFEPVRWRGRDYIDGAVGKVAHADVALARGARLIVIVNPLVPWRNNPDREDLPTPLVGARHIRDKGLLAVYSQAGKMSTYTKLHQGLRRYRATHPEVALLAIEPLETESDMFLHNPMSFESRRRLVRYGYDSTARLLLDGRASWAEAFARVGVGVVPDGLKRHWELR
jgi:predicted acylesterase/phospholipase RssA